MVIIERLKNRPDFLRASKARKWATAGLILQYRKRATTEYEGSAAIRIGFTASKKVGNAVARNRAKRRLRALAHELLAESARIGSDYVLIGRRSTLDRTIEDLRRDLQYAIKKVHEDRKTRRTEKK